MQGALELESPYRTSWKTPRRRKTALELESNVGTLSILEKQWPKPVLQEITKTIHSILKV